MGLPSPIHATWRRTNKRVDEAPPHALRTMRTNEQSPDADVYCSFAETLPHQSPDERVCSFAESLPRPTTPTPQHYPRQRHARTTARRRTPTGRPSVNGYARASLNACSKQVVQYSSPTRSTSAPHEHFDGDDLPSCSLDRQRSSMFTMKTTASLKERATAVSRLRHSTREPGKSGRGGGSRNRRGDHTNPKREF